MMVGMLYLIGFGCSAKDKARDPQRFTHNALPTTLTPTTLYPQRFTHSASPTTPQFCSAATPLLHPLRPLKYLFYHLYHFTSKSCIFLQTFFLRISPLSQIE